MTRKKVALVIVAVGLKIVSPVITGPEQLLAQTSARGPEGTVSGIAVDSVRGGYLRDAVVTLSNSNRTAITDSLGRFKIDSVKPGSYSLRLGHAILDTLGTGVTTLPFTVDAGSSISLVLAVPSPQTIVDHKCSVEDRQLGAAALTGIVSDADTEMPAEGAEVVVAWTDYVVGAKSVANKPQRRAATVRPDGSFFVCGLPQDLVTGVLAHRGADSTAAVPTSFANLLAIQTFHLPPTEATKSANPTATGIPEQTATRRISILRGSVTDSAGHPVKGARVAVEDDTVATVSQDDGRYSLGGLRAGTRMVTVRRIGFEPVEVVVDLHSGTPTDLPLRLTKFVPVLETVRVTALRTLGLERVGFATRMKLGAGSYITPEKLDRWNSPRLNDALRLVPMLKVNRGDSGGTTVTGRLGDCVRYFVDGHLWNDHFEGPDTFLSGAEIGAIEVYSPLFAPPEYMEYGYDGKPCASVVVWTKWKLKVR